MENFKDLNLSPALAAAIDELGYLTPTPIQAQTLPLLLAGPTDFLGLAATGTGKTAAFGIPLLESLNNSRHEVQALVICPTRELAIQVTEQLNLLGKHKKLRAVPVYGGAGYGDQIRGLKQGAQIVVATPGRLIDHLERGTIKLDKVKTVVLDEADEMISMGFKDEIESILESMEAGSYNTWLFSATMSRDVRRVADKFLENPKSVQVNKTEMLSGTVQQIYYRVKESDKPEILCKLIDVADEFYGLIFCQTKSLVADLTALLGQRGYAIDCLHGDKDQNQRERTMRAFRERRVSILVCTDVACRGLDVKDLTHVVNYSIPRELDNYVHRIGRTGRSGKAGIALSLVTPSHQVLVGKIEKLTQTKMELGAVPSRKDIGLKKINQLLQRFTGVSNPQRVEELLSDDWKTALEAMSKTEIAARLLTLEFSDTFIDREKPAAQMPGPASMPGRGEFRDRGDRGGRGVSGGFFNEDRPRGRDRDRGEYRERLKFRDRLEGGDGAPVVVNVKPLETPIELRPEQLPDAPAAKKRKTESAGDFESLEEAVAALELSSDDDGVNVKAVVRPLAKPAAKRSTGPWAKPRENRGYGDRPSYGDRPRYGEGRPPREDRGYGDRPKTFGERPKKFGDRKKTFGERPSFGGESFPKRSKFKKSY